MQQARDRQGACRLTQTWLWWSGELEEVLLGEEGEGGGQPATSPLEHASLPSLISFSWINGVMRTGARRQLAFSDMARLPTADSTEAWARRFQVRSTQTLGV